MYATCLLIIINILTKLYKKATITFEVTAWKRSDTLTHALTHTHSKVGNCGDYVALTASGLDKNTASIAFQQFKSKTIKLRNKIKILSDRKIYSHECRGN